MSQTIERRIDRIRRGEVPEKYSKRATGIVPCDWAEYSLGEIYKERKLAGDPKLPILTVSIHSGVSDGALNEDELGKKVKRIEDKTQYKTAKAGDLVFNMMRAWQGAIGVARSDGLVSPAYIVAKPEHEVFPLFMDYYMKQPRMVNMIHRQSYGVTDFRLRLYWDSFAQIQISLPPLAEQKRIVEILSTQDKIIERLEKKVEQLQLLKKSYMQKMFPQPDSDEPEIRFPGFTGPWEQFKFSELYEKVTEKNDLSFGSDRIISVANMFFKPDAKSSDDDYMKTYNVMRLGDIAFEGNKSKRFAHGRFVENTIGDGIVSHVFDVFRPIAEYDLYFWKYLINCESVMGRIMIRCTKSSTMMTSLVANDFLNEKIAVPTIDEQRRIGATLNVLDNLIALHQRKRDEEVRKKQALMQLLLTGIVRV